MPKGGEVMSDKSWSVYIHTNKTNRKVYVGISSDIDRRWSGRGAEYLSKHSPFASAIKKYGWDGFTHEVVKADITLDEANRAERKLIARYKSNINRFGRQYGYNQTDGGDGTSGLPQCGADNPFWRHHHTDEAKRRISRANKGRFIGDKSAKYGVALTQEQKELVSASLKSWYSGHKSASCKPVLYIPDGIWFTSVRDASKYYKIQASAISAVCLGRRLSAHDKRFTYSPDGSEPEYLHKRLGRRNQAQMMREAKSIPVQCIETGIVYESAKTAAFAVGIKSGGDIGRCCKGKSKTAGGFHWQYTEVSQYRARYPTAV